MPFWRSKNKRTLVDKNSVVMITGTSNKVPVDLKKQRMERARALKKKTKEYFILLDELRERQKTGRTDPYLSHLTNSQISHRITELVKGLTYKSSPKTGHRYPNEKFIRAQLLMFRILSVEGTDIRFPKSRRLNKADVPERYSKRGFIDTVAKRIDTVAERMSVDPVYKALRSQKLGLEKLAANVDHWMDQADRELEQPIDMRQRVANEPLKLINAYIKKFELGTLTKKEYLGLAKALVDTGLLERKQVGQIEKELNKLPEHGARLKPRPNNRRQLAAERKEQFIKIGSRLMNRFPHEQVKLHFEAVKNALASRNIYWAKIQPSIDYLNKFQKENKPAIIQMGKWAQSMRKAHEERATEMKKQGRGMKIKPFEIPKRVLTLFKQKEEAYQDIEKTLRQIEQRQKNEQN